MRSSLIFFFGVDSDINIIYFYQRQSDFMINSTSDKNREMLLQYLSRIKQPKQFHIKTTYSPKHNMAKTSQENKFNSQKSLNNLSNFNSPKQRSSIKSQYYGAGKRLSTDQQLKIQPLQLKSDRLQTQPAEQSYKNTPRSSTEEIKARLNEKFLNESKNNNTGACLQLLEPALVHSLRNKIRLILKVKLPITAKIDLDLKACLSARDPQLNTALHYTAKNGNSQLCSALIFKQIEIDPKNKDRMTPLTLAACYNRPDIVEMLLNSGAEINHQDLLGNTPLHYACKYETLGYKKTIEIFLQKYSTLIGQKNKFGQTPCDMTDQESIKQLFVKCAKEKEKASKENLIQIEQTSNEKLNRFFQKKQTNVSKIQFQVTNTTLEGEQQQPSQQPTQFNPSDLSVLGMIGKGSFGEVYLVQKQDQLYAMKVLHKSRIVKHNLHRYAMTERNVLSITAHPFIVKLHQAFQTQDKLFMLLEYCPGGDLGELLQKHKRIPEELVKFYMCEIILALEDLHKRDIIFRDLKPENIVMDREGHVLLTDFGLSKEGILEAGEGARSFCGSVAYLAPEMLKRCGHGKAVDWYLLGVVMFELLTGLPPYYANNRDDLFHNIEFSQLKMPSYISPEGKQLLKALLQRNPAKRLGSGRGDSEEIKVHPYFSGVNWQDVYKRKLKLPVPHRKIKIKTNIQEDVFQIGDSFVGEQEIKGWSFIC